MIFFSSSCSVLVGTCQVDESDAGRHKQSIQEGTGKLQSHPVGQSLCAFVTGETRGVAVIADDPEDPAARQWATVKQTLRSQTGTVHNTAHTVHTYPVICVAAPQKIMERAPIKMSMKPVSLRERGEGRVGR